LTLCRTCGHRLHCPNCTSWLVEHRALHHLQCHHCGHREAPPERCPSCNGEGTFAACGPGVERLAEEAGAKLPGIRIAIAASDTLNGPKAAAALVRPILEERVNLVIGTQILAKGHHFPMLTLVGVVDADLGLAGGDLRAAERTYQLLHQVAGRAGRGAHPGRVLLQTYMPDHPVMGALISGERDRFLEEEASARRKLGLPPFGRLAGIIVSGPDEGAVATTARELARRAPRQDGLSVLGPAPAPLSRLGGRHRWRLLVKARKDVALQAMLRHWLAGTKPARGVKLKVDIDPYSFL
jgi:primosomal protein N' (replication factor Y)